MMGSNGGLLSVERTCRQPVALVESGPIGGCIGAGAYAEALGFDNVIAFDMGGTTAKCALVENGRFSVEFDLLRRRLRQGLPDQVVGHRHRRGRLRRRLDRLARSAEPPARRPAERRLDARARSATAAAAREPTVTDANLVLGRLNADRFLGGELRARRRGRAQRRSSGSPSRSAIAGATASIEMADGILSIATVIMAGAIKQISVEHGLDPRDFVLFCYGGGGPLHAGALARELSIPTVVIPPEPGNFSAIGMLLADARLDLSKTFVGVLDDSDGRGAATRPSREMEARGARRADARNSAPATCCSSATPRCAIAASATTSRCRSPDSPTPRRHPPAPSIATTSAATAMPMRRAAAEFQALHLSAFTRLRRPDLARLPRAATAAAAAAARGRSISAAGGMLETQVYDRAALAPGFAAAGPAVDRGIRLDDAGLAGRPLRDRGARRNPHRLRQASRCAEHRDAACRASSPPPARSIRSRSR